MKKQFLTGLALLLPLIVTLWVVSFVIHLFTKPFMGLMTGLLETLPDSYSPLEFLQSRELLLYISRILILIILFATIVAIGWLTQWYLVHQLIRLGDTVFHGIPMINNIYKITQEVMGVLFNSKDETSKQPVLVPFPHARAFVIGLAMRRMSAKESPLGADSISVLILGSPHPSISYILLYRREEVQALDMTVEEAVKCIVSCAALQTHLSVKEFYDPRDLLLDHS